MDFLTVTARVGDHRKRRGLINSVAGSLHKSLPAWFRFRRYKYRVRDQVVKGLPEGISRERLIRVCNEYLNWSVKSVSHVKLSGWKTSGAYRLLIRIDRERDRSLIYKKDVYDLDNIPGLRGLPVNPGRGECIVHLKRQGPLANYLPDVYLCSELTPGKEYEYLFEDLMWEYRKLRLKVDDLMMAALELPNLHHALKVWSEGIDKSELIRSAMLFPESLLSYARTHLEQYAARAHDKSVVEVCTLWPEIIALYNRDEFHRPELIVPIHGDYNRNNIHFHLKKKASMKVVDWEWAGWGLPCEDLVSLLKKVKNPKVEEQAVRVLANNGNGLSFQEHLRLYRWCQLGRGLLDGAYLAEQDSVSSRQISWLPGFITAAMLQVLRAFQELV